MAAKVVARVRERRSVLVVLEGRCRWPEPADLILSIDDLRWDGPGDGEGHLLRREVSVSVGGRRAAAQVRQGRLWMPWTTGGMLDAAAVPDTGAVPDIKAVPAAGTVGSTP